MSNPIVINPTEVVALGDQLDLCQCGHTYTSHNSADGLCPCGCNLEIERRYVEEESIKTLVERLGASGNQARLNNGCVCQDGCPACDALAESWEAMTAALRQALPHLEQMNWNKAGAAAEQDARAALALAAKVKT